jgi:transposase/macrodomain Ter protein organizer (MatP/YcbG family)
MRRFVEGIDRGQATLFPECLEDWIDQDTPVRAIDAFVGKLDLPGVGFDGVDPEATGRPSYHPSVLLKLYIYGYVNRVQSSRRLEREAGRNVEVMWLTCRLIPDHKTIADFRKDNGLAIKQVCVQFVELCRQMGLLTTASVAIDGSKFKAVNTRDKNYTRGKVERRRAQLEKSVARYLAQLDTADLQEPSEELAAKTVHLKEKLVKLESEMQRLAAMEKLMLASPDQQISLTDPDSRSMATSGRGSGVVGYNVQVAVDTKHHLIIAHEVTKDGSDRAQLANIACQAKEALGVDKLEAVADRGYFSSDEILACEEAGIAVTLPKPVTSGVEAKGRFGKQDFVYLSDEDVYRCPAGQKLAYHFTNEEKGLVLHRYWTNACQSCAIKQRCTTGKERRITRWEHEHVLEAVQKRLDKNPHAMRQRRETAEHPFGTLKMRMGATHFLMKRLPKVATEMALHVLAYNLTRVMNIMGIQPLMAAIQA